MSTAPEPICQAEVRDESVTLTARSLRLAFRRTDERWNHAIVGPDGQPVWAGSSLLPIGNPDPARIADPVYQEVQLHGPTAGSSLCLLVTGSSLTHHFSAAVTLSEDRDAEQGARLDFDVADRCRTPVESFAATYLVHLDSGALAGADPERIVWEMSSPTAGRLELVATPPAVLTLAEAGRKATRVQILAPIEAGSFTHRLRYGWRWTTTAGLSR